MSIVVPVPGRYINDVPAVEQDVTKKRAAELVATGAFRYPDDPAAVAAPDNGPAEEVGPLDSRES
jgi:hypothetical protein